MGYFLQGGEVILVTFPILSNRKVAQQAHQRVMFSAEMLSVQRTKGKDSKRKGFHIEGTPNERTLNGKVSR